MAADQKIIEGLTEAVAYARGDKSGASLRVVKVPQSVDVQAIRKKLGMSQKEFAMRFGFSLGSVRIWEQGHRGPEGTARLLLTIIDQAPETVERILRRA